MNMAKSTVRVDQSEVCVLLEKVLGSKSGGGALDAATRNLPPGDYQIEATLKVSIDATVGEPFGHPTYKAVPIADVIDLAQMMSGAVRPHLERAMQIAIELNAMSANGRKRPHVIRYIDGDGNEQRVDPSEVLEWQAKLDDPKARKALVPLSSQIQTGFTFRGRTDIHAASVEVIR
jgi:hypothetical protein